MCLCVLLSVCKMRSCCCICKLKKSTTRVGIANVLAVGFVRSY